VALNRNAEFAAQADLIVQPPVESFPTLDFKRTPELIEIGYLASSEALDAWDGLRAVLALQAPGRAGDEVASVTG
jgi:predicted acylesterase/phospholipase RssA